ncbi:MAG: FAD-dependent oxidoreductase [Acidobacteriota bacterium]
MHRADVVIIGSGVIGASIAWHLAARGWRDILVLDRASQPGGGSTSRATGGFRCQFGSEINIRLSQLSRTKLLNFHDEIGLDSGYQPAGYLFLARSEETLLQLRDAQKIQHACGVAEARMITPAEVHDLNPAIDLDAEAGGGRIAGAAYSPTDGFISPMSILEGYVAAATRLGVRFEYDREVHSLAEIDAGQIVNATGAWAERFGALVAPLRRNVAATVATDRLPDDMPMTIWADDGFHLRVRDGRVLLLWPDDPVVADDEWFAEVRSRTDARIPSLRDVPIDRSASWSGLYEMSPDRHAIIGRVGDRLVLANGSSGHGVMHAPAIGELVAQIVSGQPTTIDVHSLRPSRFAEGELIQGHSLL